MARNRIVNGLIKTKDWFFQVTASPSQRGTRFLTGDRPNESTFRAFFESFTNKAEVTDRAYEDNNGVTLSEKQGLTTLSTDAQAKAFQAKSDGVARAVQPSQLPEVTGVAPIIVTIDENTTARNKYEVSIDPEALQNCPCVVNSGLLVEESLPSTADIIVFYDKTSFGSTSLTVAQTYTRNWYKEKIQNTSFNGKLIEIEVSDSGGGETNNKYGASGFTNPDYAQTYERFLIWAPAYLDNYFQNCTITEPTDPDTHTLSATPVTTNTKFMFLYFIDESFSLYHSGLPNYTASGTQIAYQSNVNEVATTTYKTDYTVYLNNHSRFEFSKHIVYPSRGSNSNSTATNAMFHAFLEKAFTRGTWVSDKGATRLQTNAFDQTVDGPAGVGWALDCMDFMNTSNPFTSENVDGLEDYGWINTAYSFSSVTSMSGIDENLFRSQVNVALTGSTTGRNITLIPYLELDDGSQIINYDGAVSFTV